MTSDVIVVGGSIIGCTIAWRLAREGVPVTPLCFARHQARGVEAAEP
jgi:glycine/D-amino acid oxidase-like deaminating enzyme